MIKQRRLLLKSSVATGTIAVAASAGLLAPQAVLAEMSRDGFTAKTLDDAVKNATGGSPTESADIEIKAPDIAENGAVVPVTVSSSLPNVEAMYIFAANNPTPLTSAYELADGAEAYVSTRIKMGKTADVVAVVKSDGALFSAKKEVKVTIGGCGASREEWEAIEEFPPYELNIESGEELFNTPFANGKSYADCFENGGIGIRQNYPYFDTEKGQVVTLEIAINDCRVENGEKPLRGKKGDIADISAYMAYTSRGNILDIKIPDDPRALAAYERGKKIFYTKRGQLNMACADCHWNYTGYKVRTELLGPSLGQPTHFPVYRSKWGELGTLHRRYAGCNEQVRAKPFKAQACNWVDSAGRQSNELPQLTVIVNDDELPENQAIVLTESRSQQIDLSLSSDTDGEVIEYANYLVNQGRLEQCNGLIDIQNAANLLNEACEPGLSKDNCAVNVIANGSAGEQNSETRPGQFTIVPPALKSPIGLIYRWSAIDNDGGVSSRDITYCIKTTNDEPIGEDDHYQVEYDGTLTIPQIQYNADCSISSGGESVLGNDSDNAGADSECLAAELLTPPSNALNDFAGSFNAGGGFTYTHDGSSGSSHDSFTYRAFDGEFYSNPVTVHINVDQGSNVSPFAGDDEFTVVSNSTSNSLFVTANDWDPEGYPLSIESIVSQPDKGGSARINADGYIFYTPLTGFYGVEKFEYRVVDAAGLSDEATVSVYVSNSGYNPVAVDDTISAISGKWQYLRVLDNDFDPVNDSKLRITKISVPDQAGRLFIDIGGKLLIYRSARGFVGTETFQYTVRNSLGKLSVGNVTINVAP
ncbi:unnamed protein product [Cyprideis torosa]|uniref:L-cysteine S-thiosulfotransferase subunit SoxA n=1 Tax=Cyprideis torosa TaxID=163714 RepID=A0A7R8W2K8_9CRUS|nr:unnamed protein product [Cyprideis torosa]CAG0878731.1 unnamed protein product [Cyprideis torosa]